MKKQSAALLLGAGVLLALGAQSAVAQTLLRDPRDIAGCLCMEQSTADSRVAMDRQQQAYEAAKTEYETLSREAETQHSQVNVNDSGSINAYRGLLERRDAAELRYKNESTASAIAAVGRYNQSVQAYNGSCAGKSYDQEALAEARRTLACPK